MNYTDLKNAIIAVIRQNGNEEITGNILQQVLVAIVNSLGTGYQFMGVADTETEPGTPDQKVFYLAASDDTMELPNFGVTIDAEIAVITYDSAWQKTTLVTYDDVVTPGSGNLITSGAVYDALDGLGDVYMKLVKDAIDGHIAIWDENGQAQDSGISLEDLPAAQGMYPDFFAGFAGNLVDTRSNGTPQSFIFRKSGGDGVNYLKRIKGATIVTDGVLKNNAATALVTRGFNAWDEQWESGTLAWATGLPTSDPNYIRAKNYIPALPNTAYYFGGGVTAYAYDENYTMLARIANDAGGEIATTPAGTAFLRFRSYNARTSYDGGICINISDASRNGTYEPYWKREILLKLKEVTGIPEGGTEEDRVTIFPNGLAGVGTAQDVFYEEGGETKARVVMRTNIDLGALSWTKDTSGDHWRFFSDAVSGIKVPAWASVGNIICTHYVAKAGSATLTGASGLAIDNPSARFILVDETHANAPTSGDNWLEGVKASVELATPVVYTNLKNADNTPFTMPKMIEVDEDGTEMATFPTDTTPFAPFECDSNYSISTANLVRKINS